MIWESKSSTAHVGHDSSPALVTSISDAELLDKNSRGFQQVVLGAKRKFELKLKDLLLDSQQLPTLVLNNLNLDKLAVNPEEIGKLFGFFDKLVLEIPFNPEIVSDFACLKEAITTAFQFIELLDQGCELVTVSSERREQKPYSYLANAAGTSYPQTLLAVNQIADELNQYKQLVKTFYTTLSELAAEKASNCSSLDDSTKIENQERTKLEPLKAGWKEILSSLVLIGGAPFIAAWRVVKFTANCVRKALSATAKLFPAGIKFLSIPALAVSAPLILSREILKSTAKGLVKLRGGPLGLKLFDRDLLSPIENSLDFLSSRDARGLLKKLLDNPEKKGRIQGPEEFFEKLLVTEAYVLTGVDCKLVRLDAFLDSHGSEIDTASTKSALYKTYEVMSFEALKLRQRKGSAFHTTCTLPISEGEVSLPVPPGYKIIGLNFLNSRSQVLNKLEPIKVKSCVFGGCVTTAPVSTCDVVYVLSKIKDVWDENDKGEVLEQGAINALNKLLPQPEIYSSLELKVLNQKIKANGLTHKIDELLYEFLASYELKYTINPYITSFLRACGDHWPEALLGVGAGTCHPFAALFILHARKLGLPAVILTGNSADWHSRSFVLFPRHAVAGTLSTEVRTFDLTRTAIRDKRFDFYKPRVSFWNQFEEKLKSASREEVYKLACELREDILETGKSKTKAFQGLREYYRKLLNKFKHPKNDSSLGPEWQSEEHESFRSRNEAAVYFAACIATEVNFKFLAEEAVRTKNYSFILPAVLNLDPLRFRADAFDSSATNDLTQEEIDRLQAGYDPRVIVMRALVKIIEATAPADPELKKYLEDFFQYFSPRFKPGIIHRFSPRDIKVTYDREITTALNPRFIEGVASRNFLQKLSPEQICQFLDLINHNLSFELIPLQQRSLDDQGIFTSSEKSRPSAVHRNNLNQEQIEAAIGLYLLVMENPSFSKVDMSQDLQQSILTTISYLYAAYSRDAELFSSGSSLKAAKTKSDLVEVFLRISKLPVEGAELTDQTQIFRAWINNYLNSSEIGQVCFEIILSDSNLNYPNLNLGFQSREVGRLCLQAVESLISASEQVTSDLVIRLIDRISKLNDSGVSIEGQEIIQLRNILSKLDFTELFKADPLALGSLLEPSPICKLFLLKSNFKAAKFYRSAKNFCEKHNIPLDILLAGIEFPGSERREKTEKDLTQAFIKFAELVSTNHGLELRVVKRGKSWRDNQKDVWISGFDILRSNKFTEFLLYTYRCRSSEDARDNNNFTDFGNSDFHSLMNSVIELVNRLDGSEAELDEIYASLDSDTLVDIGYSLVDGNKGGIDLFKSNNSQFQQVMRGIVKGQISRLFQGVSPQEAYRSIVWVNFVLDFLKEEHLKNTKNSRREFNLTSAIFNHIPNFAVLERGFPEGERVDAAESIRTALAKLPSLPFDEVHEAELSSRAKTAALITFGLLKLHPRENLESHYSSAKEIVAEELLSMLGICGKLANPICSDLLKKLDEPASGWQLLFSTWPENGGIDLLKICDQLVAEFSHILRSQNRRLRTVYRGYLVDKTGKFFPISSAGDPVHLRHYQIGDDPKTINTKVSARRDRTVVNVYEEQEIRKVQMFIDVDYLVDRFEVARGEFRAKVNLDRVKEVFRQIFLANLQGLPLELTICGRGEIKTYRGLGRTATLLKEYILMRKQDREADAEYLYNDPDSVTIFRALFNELKLIFEASVSTLRAEAAIYGQEGFPAINVFPQAEALKHSLNVLHVLFISRKNLRATSIPLTSMRKNKMHLAVITE